MGNVYCRYCRYLRDRTNFAIEHYNCAHPQNLKEPTINWVNGSVVPVYIRTANEINKNNDCRWFSQGIFEKADQMYVPVMTWAIILFAGILVAAIFATFFQCCTQGCA